MLPVLKNKRTNYQKQKQHDETWEDESRTLDPTQLFSKDIKVILTKFELTEQG